MILTELTQFSGYLPIPHAKAEVSYRYYDMRTDPIEGAGLSTEFTKSRAYYVWNQSVHERPIPWGLNDPMPTPLRQNLLTQTLLRIEATHA